MRLQSTGKTAATAAFQPHSTARRWVGFCPLTDEETEGTRDEVTCLDLPS